MHTVYSSILLTSATLLLAPTDAYCAPSASNLLTAWHDPGDSLTTYTDQDSGVVRAITPDLDFAKSTPSPDDAVETSRTFYVFPLTERATVGFGVGESPVGPRSFALNPSLAYTLNSHLAVSVGLDTTYFEPARANASTACVGLAADGVLPLYTCSDAISYAPANVAGGRVGSVDGDGWGYGYNLGATLTLGEGTRLGMRYRSGMQVDVADETVFHTAGPLLSTDLARLTDQAVIAGLGLPESFAVSASHRLSDQWSIAGDVTWVNWSQFEDARIASSKDSRFGTSTEDWENTYRYTLGVNYQHNDQWKYRVGTIYDQSPPSNYRAGAAQPLINEELVWVAFGVGFSPTPRLSLDVGYAYPVFTDPHVSNGVQHNLAGQFEGESDILSAQFKWRFE